MSLKSSLQQLRVVVSQLIGANGVVVLPNAEKAAIVNGGVHKLFEINLDEPIDLCVYDVIHFLSLAHYCLHLLRQRVREGELLAELMVSMQHTASHLAQNLTDFEH